MCQDGGSCGRAVAVSRRSRRRSCISHRSTRLGRGHLRSVSVGVGSASTGKNRRKLMMTYHRQPLQASSRQERHGNCRPRNPSARLSRSGTERQHMDNEDAINIRDPTSMAEPSRLDELHAERACCYELGRRRGCIIGGDEERESVERMAKAMSIKKSRLRRAWIATP